MLLIDADQQRSAQTAVTMRAEADVTPPLTCVQITDARSLRVQLPLLAAKHDDTVIDLGGRDNFALRQALGIADVLVVPVQPRAVEVWALGEPKGIVELVDDAQAAREADAHPPLRVAVVLNLADPGMNPDTIEATKAVAEFPQLSLIEPVIRRRKAIANAMATGQAVTEWMPRDAKACEEISQLVSYIFARKDIDHDDHKAKARKQGA